MVVFTSIATALLGAGSAWIGITAAGLQIAAGAVVSALTKGASNAEPQAPKFGVQGQLTAGEDVPRSIALGESCTAGSLAWHGTFGPGGTMSARVIALYDLPIRELRYAIVGGVDATLLKGETHPDYGWPVAEYRVGGVDHLWLKFYDGQQLAADPFLVSTFASDPDRPYQASRVGRGVAYVIVFARAPERNDEGEKPLFQGIPELKFVTYGTRWYNPAQDSTVGGAGAHRWNDPSTWGGVGDFNPFVHLYNLKRGVSDRVSGNWLYGMQGTSAARLPVANWIAAINAAQVAIDGPAGPEPTYRAGGEVQVGAQVAQTEEALLTAANARLVENGGSYTVFVGPPGAPVMAFTDGDILSTEEQSFSPFLSLSDTVNGIVASYPNPAEGWNDKKFTKLRPDLEYLAGNRRLVVPISLDLVPYSGQVQRLVKWAIDEAQRARRHTFVLGPEFRVIEPGDVVRWTSARNGYVDKLFRVDGVVYKSNLDVIVDLTEVDPADYDWDQEVDYRPVIDGPLQLVGPKPMPMSGWQVFPWEWERRPSALVHFASGMPGVQRVRVQVRSPDENGALIFDSDNHPYADPWRAVLQGQFAPNMPIVVRGIFVGPPAAEWSGWFAITTPNVKLTSLDVVYGDIDLDALGNQVEGYFDWMGKSMREVIEQAQAQALLSGDQDLANAGQFDEIRRSLSTVVGNLSASFDETITTAIVPMQGQLVAVADALTELSAADEGDVNTARFRMTAQTGVGGGVKIAAQARTGTEGDWRDAGWFLNLPNDDEDPSQFLVLADQFVVAESPEAATYNPFIFESGTLRVSAAFIGDLTAENMATRSLTADVIAANTLTSAEIDVQQLVASAAFLTYLQVGSANIGNAVIETANIKAGNVTETVAFVDDASIALGSFQGDLITIATASINTNVGQVLIQGEFRVTGSAFVMYLRKNGTNIRPSRLVGAGFNRFVFLDNSPSNATYTVVLERALQNAGDQFATDRSLVLQNNKR